MKSKKLVPQLRFPEFINDGEWNALNGNKIFSQISNKKHNSDLPILAISQEHGAIPRELIDYNVIATTKSIASYKVIEIGDFIISLRSFQGGIEYSNYKGICSPAYIILRNKIDISKDFFRQYFKSLPFIADMNRNLEGLRDGKMVSYKQFSELLLPTPNPREQHKIADCLSSIDELISTETQKIDAFKDHKKGLMQKLFPANGATVPQYRFPEFENDGNWEEKILGEIIDYQNGKAHEKEITADGNFIVVNSKFISTEGNIVKRTNTANLLAKKGDVLMVLSDVPNGKAIAKCFLVDKDDVYTVNQRICRLNPKSVSSLVLFYLINRNKYFLSFDDGVKQTNLRKDDVLDCPIVLPNDPKEQQKIADCLSSIDELITTQAEKIESLKLHKKGLMQQLFPKV